MTSKLSVKRYLATATSRTLQRFEDSVDDHVGEPAAEGDLVAGVGVRDSKCRRRTRLPSRQRETPGPTEFAGTGQVSCRRANTDQTARWMLERR